MKWKLIYKIFVEILHYPTINCAHYKESIRELISNGADPNMKNKLGHTPLYFPNLNQLREAKDIIELLVEQAQ